MSAARARHRRQVVTGVVAVLAILECAAAGRAVADDDGHVLRGLVYRDPYCDARFPIIVYLNDVNERSTPADANGAFEFTDVPDGDYVVTAESECQPSDYGYDQVYIRGTDAYTVLHASICPQRVVVTVAADRKTADLDGRCYYIHSGAQANVYLDYQLIGMVRGSTSGSYSTTIDIDGLRLGRHTVLIAIPGEIVGRQIGVGALDLAAAACAGDCNADASVNVSELVIGVRLALDGTTAGCDRLDVDASGTIDVAELVQATDALLNGCP